MDGLFWQRLHGGSTHMPIVLLPLSLVFELVALRMPDDAGRRALRLAGRALGLTGVLGGCGAVVAGLVLTHGRMLGSGDEKMHHLFAWSGFCISVVLVAGRLLLRCPRYQRIYLIGMGIASALMLGAGYWGGEMLLHAESGTPTAISGLLPINSSAVARGHDLFLMNCAHCHGNDARGTDEAPDLTKLRPSEARIASVVKKGIKGEMPRFGQKLTDADVRMLIRFIRSLNGQPA
jgi:mono/diheme cytochrome c family protein